MLDINSWRDVETFNSSDESEYSDSTVDTDSDFDLYLSSETESEEQNTIVAPPSSQTGASNVGGIWTAAIRPPSTTSFCGNQGPTPQSAVTNINSPYDYFKLIFDDDLMNLLVEETNLYATQFMEQHDPLPSSRVTAWVPTNKGELEVFLGLNILTGLVQKAGKLESYWSKDPLLSTPYFRQCMSRNRFQLLNKLLHFNNNQQRPSNCTDKLYKVRPVYDRIIGRWRELYNPGEHIAIDEGMLKWRGRLSFRVYMKSKPVKYGIKSYILADSQNHYCWNLEVYHRSKKTILETIEGLLTEELCGLWHTLYTDNFYSSVKLSEFLLAKNIHTVGTLRNHRGEPPEITSLRKMKRHKKLSRDNGKVLILAWKHKRIVKVISTKHDNSSLPITRRVKGGGGNMETIMKPSVIVDYNKHIVGRRPSQPNACVLSFHTKVREMDEETFLLFDEHYHAQQFCIVQFAWRCYYNELF